LPSFKKNSALPSGKVRFGGTWLILQANWTLAGIAIALISAWVNGGIEVGSLVEVDGALDEDFGGTNLVVVACKQKRFGLQTRHFSAHIICK
jgi:hypothetical protein